MLTGVIDSVDFDIDDDILDKLERWSKCKIAIVKNRLIFKSELLRHFYIKGKKSENKKNAFRSSLYYYLAVIYSDNGIWYKITQHSRQKGYTLAFQGLKQYSLIDELKRKDLEEFINFIKIDNLKLSRLDIAFDSNTAFNTHRIAHKIKRDIYQYKNTTYLKTGKEKRMNSYCNLKHYEKLKGLYRFEFSFCRGFLNKCSSIDEVKTRCDEVIKRVFGIRKAFKFQTDFSPFPMLIRKMRQGNTSSDTTTTAFDKDFKLTQKTTVKEVKKDE
jgi:hypothetical protein